MEKELTRKEIFTKIDRETMNVDQILLFVNCSYSIGIGQIPENELTNEANCLTSSESMNVTPFASAVACAGAGRTCQITIRT